MLVQILYQHSVVQITINSEIWAEVLESRLLTGSETCIINREDLYQRLCTGKRKKNAVVGHTNCAGPNL